MASAGNDNGGPVRYPANLAEVIAVGATTGADGIADFSNVGPELELTAPGVYLYSTTVPYSDACGLGAAYGQCSGTSFAAPMVAAAAAMVMAEHPFWTPEQIRSRLRSSALDLGAPGRDNMYGHGRLDAAGAVGYTPPSFLVLKGRCVWLMPDITATLRRSRAEESPRFPTLGRE